MDVRKDSVLGTLMETLYTIWGALVGLSVLATGVAYLMVKRADAK